VVEKTIHSYFLSDKNSQHIVSSSCVSGRKRAIGFYNALAIWWLIHEISRLSESFSRAVHTRAVARGAACAAARDLGVEFGRLVRRALLVARCPRT
jgi:hypothetical protein